MYFHLHETQRGQAYVHSLAHSQNVCNRQSRPGRRQEGGTPWGYRRGRCLPGITQQEVEWGVTQVLNQALQVRDQLHPLTLDLFV